MVAKKPGNLPHLLDWLGHQLGQKAADLSVRLGWERVVLQVLGENGQVLGYAKVPETLLGERANEKETQILNKLNALPDFSGLIPKVLGDGHCYGSTLLVHPHNGFGPASYTKNLTPEPCKVPGGPG